MFCNCRYSDSVIARSQRCKEFCNIIGPKPCCVSPHYSLRPATDRRGGRLGTLEDQHAHCLSVNRGDVLDAAAAAPPQLCGTGMAQVSVRGLGGRGSERLRAEASRLRRPTTGRVVLRAANSFLSAQSSASIFFGLSGFPAGRRRAAEWSRTWDRAE